MVPEGVHEGLHCTIECKSLADHGDMIKKFNTTYFMVSVDTLDDNKGFAEQQHADFPLLSDPTKKTAEDYGVLNQGGVANRWTFYMVRTARSPRSIRRSSRRRRPKTWWPNSVNSASPGADSPFHDVDVGTRTASTLSNDPPLRRVVSFETAPESDSIATIKRVSVRERHEHSRIPRCDGSPCGRH